MNIRQKKKQRKIKYMKRWGDIFPSRKEIRRNKWLIQRYPWLMPRNVWTGKIPEDYYYEYVCNDIPCPGWQKRFQTKMFEEIRAELIRCSYLDEFRVIQSKEKYGGLRYYTGGIPEECKVYEIIGKYEELSEHVCMVCGRDSEIIADCGWLECICEDCWSKREIRRWCGEPRPYPGVCHGE